jgi:hypothetical protein
MYEESKKYYESIIKITTKNCSDWQKIQIDALGKDEESKLFEDDKSIILDPYLAHAHIKKSVLFLVKGDLKSGKKSVEKGVTILKKIYDSLHPEMSKALVDQASLLKEFTKEGAKQFFPEINRYL